MSSEPHAATDAIETDRPQFADVRGALLSTQAVLGRKWVPLIVYHLLRDGPMGFSALGDRIGGISAKMLSESLDALEETGLVDREVVSDRPTRVCYALTDRGAALEPLIAAMIDWGRSVETPPADVEGDPPTRGDARHSSGPPEPGR